MARPSGNHCGPEVRLGEGWEASSRNIIKPNGLTFPTPSNKLNHVVSHQIHLDNVFHALSDPTRRMMLRSLAAKNQNIAELAAPFPISFPASSKHLRVLESAGLVSRNVHGRTHVFQIVPGPLAEADRWLRFYEDLWNEQLDALQAMLSAESAATSKSKKGSRAAKR